MNKYEEFVKFFDWLVDNCKQPVELPPAVREVKEQLITQSQTFKEKPLFTESGLQILEYLQGTDPSKMKASDIAQGMGISSRKVSGAIRKLVTDEFVDKFGSNPVIYSLTEKGKNFDLNAYKETMNDEKDN